MKFLSDLLSDKKRTLFGVIAVLISGFAGLSYFVIITPPSFLDLHVSEELQERHSVLLDSAMKLVSWFGNVPQSIILVAVTATLFLVFSYRKEALFTLITLISGLLSSAMKLLLNRPRPTEDLVRIIEKAKRQSFPSGHTLFYTIFFGFLVIAMTSLRSVPLIVRIVVGTLSALMIFFVPVSRVYLGAHWFTDVLGGFVLGIICLFFLGYIYLFGLVNNKKNN